MSGEALKVDKIISLAHFLVLRKVGLPLGSLIDARLLDNSLGFYNPLPPCIEVLQIELPNEWDHNRYRPEGSAITKWICEIARRKYLHYPQFKKLIWWHQIETGQYMENILKFDTEPFVSLLEEVAIEMDITTDFDETFFAIRDLSDNKQEDYPYA